LVKNKYIKKKNLISVNGVLAMSFYFLYSGTFSFWLFLPQKLLISVSGSLGIQILTILFLGTVWHLAVVEILVTDQ
jgi:hypothetical protein